MANWFHGLLVVNSCFFIMFVFSLWRTGFISPSSRRKSGENHAVKLKRNLHSSVSRPSPTFSAEIVCKIFPDFTAEQTNFCMKHPRLASAIAKGIETGLRECENQFQHHRWNCTSTYREIASFGQNRAVQGTKEGAFVNAIVAAGVAHSVTLACARNNITGCTCATNEGRRISQRNWENGGCSNNIAHGIDISKRFLHGSRGAKRKRYELQIRHNRESGWQAVRKSLVDFHCNCHGVSGACTSKTCWEILSSSFERVGRFLKARYEKAVLVSASYTDTREGKIPKALILPGTIFVKPPKEKLVYLDKSPTYCDPLPNKGVAGTRARSCDHLSKDTDGCDALCCGRGYNKIVFTTRKRCRCRFLWCCEVKCGTCKIEQEQTVCK